jgi:hypothetical protein
MTQRKEPEWGEQKGGREDEGRTKGGRREDEERMKREREGRGERERGRGPRVCCVYSEDGREERERMCLCQDTEERATSLTRSLSLSPLPLYLSPSLSPRLHCIHFSPCDY